MNKQKWIDQTPTVWEGKILDHFYSLHLQEIEKEIVICAAVRAKDGIIVRGHRHVHAMRALQDMPAYKNERPHGDDQGFVTSMGRYVTRKEGCKLQIAAGVESVDKEKPYCGGELYSEDLY